MANESGNTMTTLSEADTRKLFDMTRVLRDDWVAHTNAASLDGEALMQNQEATVAELK